MDETTARLLYKETVLFHLCKLFNLSRWVQSSQFSDERDRLCWGYETKNNIRDKDSCFRTLDRIFDNADLIHSAKVGKGDDVVIKDILRAEIMPLVREFEQNTINDKEYEARLQNAADRFTIMATGLPRTIECIPPCGFQVLGMIYNCETCQYDICELPLDCPVQQITVRENNKTQMWCKVPFDLPSDIQIVWRYAEMKTVLVDRFKEVTVGVDELYSITAAQLEHSGTYQCEIFSEEQSLVRIYYHLTVTPFVVVGQAKLQAVFEQALLPAGQFPLLAPVPPYALLRLPSPALLAACLSSLLLLLFFSCG